MPSGDEVLADYQSGLSQPMIAAKYRIPRTRVFQMLNDHPDYVARSRHQIHPSLRKADYQRVVLDYQSGMTQEQIAAKHKISQPHVLHILHKRADFVPNRKVRGGTGKRRWPAERIALAVDLYATGLPIGQVAAILQTSRTHLKDALRRRGIRIRPQGEAQTGQYNPSWNGGSTFLGEYRYLLRPKHPHATQAGYVAEHRLIVENIVGRYLEPQEVVHHKDRNPRNNDPGNLQLFASNGEHLAFELKGRVPKWTVAGRARILEGVRKPRPQCRKNGPSKSDAPS